MNHLRAKLDSIYQRYHHPDYLTMDPLLCVHDFKTRQDREAGGLIASVLAYGRAEIIIKDCNWIFQKTEWKITDFINLTSFKEKQKFFESFKHRFNDGLDMSLLTESLKQILRNYKNLENLFAEPFKENELTIRSALHHFSNTIRKQGAAIAGFQKKSFDYLFPSPESGSACKRLNMFLRWMVRENDSIDFGLWKKVPASKLIIPVDTHVAALSRKMGLTTRKAADWKMAEEITGNLRRINPEDPVRYDFSLCRAGMIDFRKDAA